MKVRVLPVHADTVVDFPGIVSYISPMTSQMDVGGYSII